MCHWGVHAIMVINLADRELSIVGNERTPYAQKAHSMSRTWPSPSFTT